ncbi:class I SAM-dependent methyltransferase [Alicycliphilus denitrificans]|uniref:class I SAM-dependent methyltransferase n=1 Tax=Alicycliphilus denitrificans TaxID=179636 RepID=UPI0001DA059B|nr:class I SAM-dependent methyltransferase [Alicycliphilus denitrificans]ADU97842.1 methyltransferase type 12 [Alicycliphilus denitrificans BC]
MRLSWPLPALLAWGVAWLLHAVLQPRLGTLASLLGATGVGVLASLWGQNWWRRALIALGFPLSLALTGAAGLPAWAWLLPLAVLLLVYPLNAWRDAPLFPTPRGALHGLDALAPLPSGAAVLDAGCGLGDGLLALRAAYPRARLHGLEWSWPLALLCRLRCPWAHVRRGDIWAAGWGDYQLVYVFQRPESMARAAAKALAEMAPGSWLVSLAFEVPGLAACARLPGFAGQGVWIYRMGASAAAPRGATKECEASADVTL